jgi:hypothetical protein
MASDVGADSGGGDFGSDEQAAASTAIRRTDGDHRDRVEKTLFI